MTRAKTQFEQNIQSILVLDSIYDFLVNQVTAFDISELLRAEYFLIVSALDHYIHEAVRDGLLRAFGSSAEMPGLKNIAIPLQQVQTLLLIDNEFERKKFLGEAIKKVTSKDAYQSPKSVEYALGLLNIKSIWTTLCENTTRTPEDARNQLALIVHRRNKIAHESDIDFSTGEKTPIDKETIIDCLSFVKWFINSVDVLVETKELDLFESSSPT